MKSTSTIQVLFVMKDTIFFVKKDTKMNEEQ